MIEFLTAEGVSPIDMHRRMKGVYGDDCVDFSTVTVKRWAVRPRTENPTGANLDVCDKQRRGRPRTATNEPHRNRVDELIREKRCITH